MRGVIKKSGDSAAIGVPAAVPEEGGRSKVEPLHPARYDIDALIAAITDENRHAAVETGPAIGREA